MDRCLITPEPLDLAAATAAVADAKAGAVCSFLGVVRNHNEGKAVERLSYEAYAAMAEKVMERLVAQARQRWDFHRAALQHRTGELAIGEASVLVAVSASHREEAFAACRFLIDRLKEEAPIWKKEFYADGAAWLENAATPPSGVADE